MIGLTLDRILVGLNSGLSLWMWGWVLDSDVVGAARDVLISPLDHQDVFSLLFELVADIVQAVAQMFHYDLLTGNLGTVHTD